MFDQIPPELKNATAGVAGSAVALFFLRRPPWTMVGMFIGGSLLAFYGTEWVSIAFNMGKAERLVSFMLGLFGMALIAKLHDTIDAISPAELWNSIRKKVGLE